MAVYQVEEYYITIKVPEDRRNAVDEFLSDECYFNFQYTEDGELIVDDIESEHDAESLEESIMGIL